MLRGSLDDFSLEDIFWLVAHAQNTGELRVTRPAGSGRFFFRDGEVYCAESDLVRESFGLQLVRAGVVTRDLLSEVEAARADGERLGSALVARGALDEDDLRAAYRERLEETTFELIRREFGEFVWEPDVKAEPEYSVSIAVDELLASIGVRFDELAEIRKVVPSEAAVPKISAAMPDGKSEVTITANQWRLLALVDGRNSIEQIGRRVEMSDLTVLRTLYPLANEGLLQVAEERALPEVGVASDESLDTSTLVATRPFNIVLVCTGNRVRSPMAEAFLRQLIGHLPVALVSVGVEDWGSQPAMPEAVEAARDLGVDLSSHRAKPLAGADLAGADVVIGFERAHVVKAIEQGKAPRERTFTLVELVEHLNNIDPPREPDRAERARTAIARAHAGRSQRVVSSIDVDIVDPLGGPSSAYRNTATRIRELCERLAVRLFGEDAG